jgi:hypothetical protein
MQPLIGRCLDQCHNRPFRFYKKRFPGMTSSPADQDVERVELHLGIALAAVVR